MRSPTDPRPPAPDFGRVSAEHAQIFIGIMGTLHSEPTASAFGRLLKKRLGAEDYILLAHVFEEISVLILHRLIPEALLFDAFAFDLSGRRERTPRAARRPERPAAGNGSLGARTCSRSANFAAEELKQSRPGCNRQAISRIQQAAICLPRCWSNDPRSWPWRLRATWTPFLS